MNEGDTATIYVPSPYGFKDEAYQSVPPHSILKYKVRFVKIKNLDTELEKIDQYITDKNMTAEIDSVFGTRYVIHQRGNNVGVKSGSFISLNYQGELLDGTAFDDGRLDFTFLDTNPNNRLIIGFEMGLFHLHENDSATIFVPSIYGYKSVANGDIPANSVLVFGLDILRVSNSN
jgi:FKBP-type peptidyl-prolyl cis-trans isomerase FkpA